MAQPTRARWPPAVSGATAALVVDNHVALAPDARRRVTVVVACDGHHQAR